MRTRIAAVLLALFLSSGGILILYQRSVHPPDIKNGFNRLFISVAQKSKSLTLQEAAYYIAGITDKEIFLGIRGTPDYLIKTDYGLSKAFSVPIKISTALRAAWNAGKISIDSPHIWLTEGSTPTLLSGYLTNRHINSQVFFDKGDYLSIDPIPPSTLLIREYDPVQKRTQLSKRIMYTHHLSSPTAKFAVSPAGTDKFSTDGMLIYSSKNAMLIYVYYYTNQFIALDTNLNVRFLMRSIDTVTIPKFTVDTIPSRHSVTLSSPPRFINTKAAVNGGQLIILSPSMADNERKDQFDKNLVFDIYDLLSKTYLHSFYIPRSGRQHVKDIRWTGNCLYLLFENSLVSYTIR